MASMIVLSLLKLQVYLCAGLSKTQVQLAEEIDTTKAYVNRVIKKQDGAVNKTFVQMMEALGYDIELTYVKRE